MVGLRSEQWSSCTLVSQPSHILSLVLCVFDGSLCIFGLGTWNSETVRLRELGSVTRKTSLRRFVVMGWLPPEQYHQGKHRFAHRDRLNGHSAPAVQVYLVNESIIEYRVTLKQPKIFTTSDPPPSLLVRKRRKGYLRECVEV